ncbi:hypothetical protein D3C76_1820500 [compost metagenome]
MSNKWSCLFCILNHLWYGTFLTFWNEEDIVSDNIYVLMIQALQFVIGFNTLATFLCNIQVTNEF